MSYYLYASGVNGKQFDTEQDAIQFARDAKLDSFEVRNEEDRQVFLEFPEIIWL